MRGGLRPNAGRKKANHTIAAEQARATTIEMVTSELKPILQAQIDAAKGLWYETKEGRVYQEKPDVNASKYLLDQTIGKAKEVVEHTGEVSLKLDV